MILKSWFGNSKKQQELKRVFLTLENSTTSFMITDVGRNIVFANKAVLILLREAESDIRKDLPHFTVSTLLGSNIDIFHKSPEHQKNILSHLRHTHVAQIEVGGRSFKLVLNPLIDDEGKSLGTSVEWHDMTETLFARLSSQRVISALDSTSTNVMIANDDRKIIYLNRSVLKMLQTAESDIREALPHFSVDKVLGSNMDIFHKNPAHQMTLLERLTSSYTGNITIGKRHFRLIANPIFSNDNERLGSVVEWQDRTQEVLFEKDIGDVVDVVIDGDFSPRISIEGKSGFFLKLAEGLNHIMANTENALSDIGRVLKAIAKGDLTENVEADYSGIFLQLKNSCNETSRDLAVMLTEIQEAAETINTASAEISQGNADLSGRTEQQASSLEETASSMEELTGTVRQNADNAKEANLLAAKASKIAENGGVLIEQVVDTMGSINESSQKISDIIRVIDGIAFQTNILALNAAVEAARAGDQGRGFAVVASEVRALAQRSADAAKDIKGLIADSVSKINIGSELVSKSGTTMKNIVKSIKQVNDIMAEIAAASAEQSAGIDEVGKAVNQMDEMTQQNAALVEQAAAAAESLLSQAEQLSRNVATFKLNDDYSFDEKTINQRNPAFPPQKKVIPPPRSNIKKSGIKPKKPLDDEWESF